MAQNGAGKKALALAAMLEGATQEQAAAAAGVSARTMVRWNAEFTPLILAHEQELLAIVTRRLGRLAEKAVSVLEDSMADGSPAYVRIQGAKSALDYLLKLRELTSFEARLKALEEALNDSH